MFTVISQTGKDVDVLGMNMKPESIPGAGVVMFAHGAAKVDCVTVWFLAKNWKRTRSPALTPLIEGGL